VAFARAVVVAGLLVTVSRAVIDTIKLLAVTNARGVREGMATITAT
jgi:hypothetical protein